MPEGKRIAIPILNTPPRRVKSDRLLVLARAVLARSGQATSDLIDVDHIEVLRGPQGTLLGRNAAAGAVNIVTAQSTEAFHGFADASYLEGDEYRLNGGISGTHGLLPPDPG